MATIKLEVITPSKKFYSGDVELVIARTLSGEEGFMAGHAWACKLLDVDALWIREAGQKEFRVAALAGGEQQCGRSQQNSFLHSSSV